MSIINFHVGFPALTNVKDNFPMEERICFEILQSVIHNINFIQYSHLLHPIKLLVFILTVSNLRLLSSLVIYNLFPLDESLTFLSCITHHSHLHYSSLSSALLITLICITHHSHLHYSSLSSASLITLICIPHHSHLHHSSLSLAFRLRPDPPNSWT